VALNPAALAVLAGLACGWAYLLAVRTAPVVIGGRTLSEKEAMLAAGGASVVVVFFLTTAGAVLLSALGLSAAAVAAHGALRAPDDLFTDEVEVGGGGGGGGGGRQRVSASARRRPTPPSPALSPQAPGGFLGMLTGGGAARAVAAAV
jgi:hypothetical protein